MERCGQTRVDVSSKVSLRQLREQGRLRCNKAGHRSEQGRAQVGDAQARVLHTREGLGFKQRCNKADHRVRSVTPRLAMLRP